MLSLGEARATASQAYAVHLNGQHATGVCDEWFVDDGQALVTPSKADMWLRCLDEALAGMGSTRLPESGDVKSVARLICQPGQETAYSGWDTAYIRQTCKVKTMADGAEVLGSVVSSSIGVQALAEKVVRNAAATQEAISSIDHPATQLVLTRQCADVAKLTHVLRTVGDLAAETHLEQFD